MCVCLCLCAFDAVVPTFLFIYLLFVCLLMFILLLRLLRLLDLLVSARTFSFRCIPCVCDTGSQGRRIARR